MQILCVQHPPPTERHRILSGCGRLRQLEFDPAMTRCAGDEEPCPTRSRLRIPVDLNLNFLPDTVIYDCEALQTLRQRRIIVHLYFGVSLEGTILKFRDVSMGMKETVGMRIIFLQQWTVKRLKLKEREDMYIYPHSSSRDVGRR
jgi:hypothetical protein